MFVVPFAPDGSAGARSGSKSQPLTDTRAMARTGLDTQRPTKRGGNQSSCPACAIARGFAGAKILAMLTVNHYIYVLKWFEIDSTHTLLTSTNECASTDYYDDTLATA